MTSFFSTFDPSWALVETGTGQDTAEWRTTLGDNARIFRRRPRPSPIAGRANIGGALFPGHVFVSEGVLEDVPRAPDTVIFRNDKGRPLCLPHSVVTDLDAYCALSPEDDVPRHLASLDVLGPAERIWFVLDTWMRWPVPVPSSLPCPIGALSR